MEKDIAKLKPTLETERLIVRPIMPDDYLDAFEWCGDPVVNKFMLYPLYKNGAGCLPQNNYIMSVIFTPSISSNAWFSPTIPQMNV